MLSQLVFELCSSLSSLSPFFLLVSWLSSALSSPVLTSPRETVSELSTHLQPADSTTPLGATEPITLLPVYSVCLLPACLPFILLRTVLIKVITDNIGPFWKLIQPDPCSCQYCLDSWVWPAPVLTADCVQCWRSSSRWKDKLPRLWCR